MIILSTYIASFLKFQIPTVSESLIMNKLLLIKHTMFLGLP